MASPPSGPDLRRGYSALRPGDPSAFSPGLIQLPHRGSEDPSRQGDLSGRQASPASHVAGGVSYLDRGPTLASTPETPASLLFVTTFPCREWAPSPELIPDSPLPVTTMVRRRIYHRQLINQTFEDVSPVRGPCDQLKLIQGHQGVRG
ncbi:hypothetical protein J6590_041225 [Homalodisca vitripennis]|nr:hypothetical protein J6590_041225 [Homalodisca vitripennis]